MPETSIWLGSVGLFGIAVAMIGFYRRQLIAIWRVKREDQPWLFWYGFFFQLGLGLLCVGGAIQEWIENSK